jgi:hypothetical protein
MTGLDRREFLLVSTAVVVAAPARAAAMPPAPVGRASTYRALVRSLRDGPDSRFHAADPIAAHRRFARWYGAQPAVLRRHADAVLDELGMHGPPTAAELAGWIRGPRRGGVVATAIGLASIGCQPPLAEDERP